MTDERYTFDSTRARLDEILVAVRKKDTSLEQSLELLEEGVRLANMCNELIDQTSWRAPAGAEQEAEDAVESAAASASTDAAGETPGVDATGPEPEGEDAAPDVDASPLEDDERE